MTVLNTMILVSVVLMPLFIFLFLDTIQPRYFAIALISIFGARFLMQFKTLSVQKSTQLWMLLMLIGLGVIVYHDNHTMLLSYPVLMNAGFLCLFLYTLMFPPTIVEQIARFQDPDLPEAGVCYTRQVTKVWCGFFLINGLIAAWTVWYGNRQIWGLYNGLISYLLTGLLMLIEYCIRCRVKRLIEHE